MVNKRHCAKNLVSLIIYRLSETALSGMSVIPISTKYIWNHAWNCHHSVTEIMNEPIYIKEIWNELWQFYAFLGIFLDISLLKLDGNIIFCAVRSVDGQPDSGDWHKGLFSRFRYLAVSFHILDCLFYITGEVAVIYFSCHGYLPP